MSSFFLITLRESVRSAVAATRSADERASSSGTASAIFPQLVRDISVTSETDVTRSLKSFRPIHVAPPPSATMTVISGGSRVPIVATATAPAGPTAQGQHVGDGGSISSAITGLISDVKHILSAGTSVCPDEELMHATHSASSWTGAQTNEWRSRVWAGILEPLNFDLSGLSTFYSPPSLSAQASILGNDISSRTSELDPFQLATNSPIGASLFRSFSTNDQTVTSTTVSKLSAVLSDEDLRPEPIEFIIEHPLCQNSWMWSLGFLNLCPEYLPKNLPVRTKVSPSSVVAGSKKQEAFVGRKASFNNIKKTMVKLEFDTAKEFRGGVSQGSDVKLWSSARGPSRPSKTSSLGI